MSESLAVWLYGTHVARIEQQRGRLRLSYTDAALAAHPLGSPLLSLSMPLRSERYSHGITSAFLDGLLPEGDQRRMIADDLDIRVSDTYTLIRALGKESAGALTIQPDGGPPPPTASLRRAVPLSEARLAELVAALRNAPLAVRSGVRLSLAGVQEKLALTRLADGSWGLPADGTPSTHILKPQLATYPGIVENEAFCMRFARLLGIDVAPVETALAGDRALLVIERYDRTVHEDGTVERIHQEDFCQALAIHPHKKYQEDGGPSLRRIAELLQTAAPPGSLELLLRAVTINVLTGNGDAHGKNYSLLHDRSGALRMAPLYDVLSTLLYGQERLAMTIDNVTRIDRVTSDRLLNEAARWGLSRARARAVLDEVIDRTPAAADAAAAATPGTPARLRKVLNSQLDSLRKSLSQ